jgi:hypothetical protein
VALDTYIVTWERVDDRESTFNTRVVAGDIYEAWDAARAEARLSLGDELNRWTVVKMERVTAVGRERVV